MGLLPQTRLGRLASALAAVFLGLVAVSFFTIGRQNTAGGDGGISWFQPGSPAAIALGTLMLAAGLGALVAGLVSVAKFKDRSLTVMAATMVGLFAVLILVLALVEGLLG